MSFLHKGAHLERYSCASVLLAVETLLSTYTSLPCLLLRLPCGTQIAHDTEAGMKARGSRGKH